MPGSATCPTQTPAGNSSTTPLNVVRVGMNPLPAMPCIARPAAPTTAAAAEPRRSPPDTAHAGTGAATQAMVKARTPAAIRSGRSTQAVAGRQPVDTARPAAGSGHRRRPGSA